MPYTNSPESYPEIEQQLEIEEQIERFEAAIEAGDEHDNYDCYLGLDPLISGNCYCRCHVDDKRPSLAQGDVEARKESNLVYRGEHEPWTEPSSTGTMWFCQCGRRGAYDTLTDAKGHADEHRKIENGKA